MQGGPAVPQNPVLSPSGRCSEGPSSEGCAQATAAAAVPAERDRALSTWHGPGRGLLEVCSPCPLYTTLSAHVRRRRLPRNAASKSQKRQRQAPLQGEGQGARQQVPSRAFSFPLPPLSDEVTEAGEGRARSISGLTPGPFGLGA